MPVIKRYPNRKLYDTQEKRYITLEGIAALIRLGHTVQVLDHATGEDLTAVTLTQIIFEQEKKRRGFVPQSILAGLIQSGGQTVGALRRTLASPLELARHVDDEIERRIQSLIVQGEMAAEEGFRLMDGLLSQRAGDRDAWNAPGDAALHEALEGAMQEHGVPTRHDLKPLFDQIDALAQKLDEMADSLQGDSGPVRGSTHSPSVADGAPSPP
jgi:polyhydroxyalkanoate synthesis repressor PhaR